jgi:hypothetical protein
MARVFKGNQVKYIPRAGHMPCAQMPAQ